MHTYLSARLPALREVCLQHQVKKLYVFGSVIDGRFRPGDSDVDMWVELKRMTKAEQARTLMQIWLSFQQILSCEVDLITRSCIRDVNFKRYLQLYQVKIFDSEE